MRSGSFRSTVTNCARAVIISFCCLPLANSQGIAGQPRAAILKGRVADARGRPIAGSTVYLLGNNENLSSQTDSDGNYFMSFLGPSTYSGHAEAAGYEPASFGPFTFAENQLRILDITLRAKEPEQRGSLSPPEFFDQPQFTIAGVTDTTNLGGHASGMTGPTESLAKDVGSLSGNEAAATPNAELEQAARSLADEPRSGFKENHAAGTLLVKDGKPREAIPYLLRASKLNPNDYDNSFELARAYAGAAKYSEAGTLIKRMLAEHRSADLHHLLATVEEKSGNPLQAEKEFQEAAKLDPSEINLFDWGMELLTHHATEPAIEVFKRGNAGFPQSARMLSGLAAAFYERGAYDEALQYLCAASDLNPGDAGPYLLLGKMQNADRGQTDAPLTRLERFVRLQPQNPWANYYYALALWKRRKGSQDISTSAQVESLLRKAVVLDPQLAKAYFQLGVLYSEKNNLPQAIDSYEDAVRIDPQLVEAHYRLAQAYSASGQSEKGQQEIALYKQNAKAKAETADRERREVQQFVYTMQHQPATDR